MWLAREEQNILTPHVFTYSHANTSLGQSERARTILVIYNSIENVFRVCIAWYKHEKGWENSRQSCKPETKSRVCITVENSPNASSVYIRLCKHRKKVFYCFYKINFPRKNAKLFVWHWLKEKFIPVAKSCPRNLARVLSVLVLQKDAFQNTDYSRLKCQLKRKTIDTLSL